MVARSSKQQPGREFGTGTYEYYASIEVEVKIAKPNNDISCKITETVLVSYRLRPLDILERKTVKQTAKARRSKRKRMPNAVEMMPIAS